MLAILVIDGTCARSSAIAARLAISRAFQTQSAGADCDSSGVVKGDRLEKIRIAMNLLIEAMKVERGKAVLTWIHNLALLTSGIRVMRI